MERIGFAGLGTMGAAMAANLARAGFPLTVWNRTPDVGVQLLADGHASAELAPGGRALVRLGTARSLLATLPEATFFRRYRETFGH